MDQGQLLTAGKGFESNAIKDFNFVCRNAELIIFAP
jgi:hypothetical protein